ncbi:MAG: hypothetical protein ACRENS_02475, partial [Candidatus Eiseniibacteriota bacterium]
MTARRMRSRFTLAALVLLLSCAPERSPGAAPAAREPARKGAARDGAAARESGIPAGSVAFLDTLERRTFDFFWERSDSTRGLTLDRWPTPSFASVGAVGFALTAYPIGVERGYISRARALDRVRHTLEFFWRARQDTARAGVTGYRGFFYHFLDPATGQRFENVELSTIDTALMLAGMLFCQSYFDRAD